MDFPVNLIRRQRVTVAVDLGKTVVQLWKTVVQLWKTVVQLWKTAVDLWKTVVTLRVIMYILHNLGLTTVMHRLAQAETVQGRR